jgi:hypothetical protein
LDVGLRQNEERRLKKRNAQAVAGSPPFKKRTVARPSKKRKTRIKASNKGVQ